MPVGQGAQASTLTATASLLAVPAGQSMQLLLLDAIEATPKRPGPQGSQMSSSVGKRERGSLTEYTPTLNLPLGQAVHVSILGLLTAPAEHVWQYEASGLCSVPTYDGGHTQPETGE